MEDLQAQGSCSHSFTKKELSSREVKQGAESESESETGEETCAAELSGVPVAEDEDGDNDLYEFAFDPYSFIKSLPPLENCVPAWRRALLPKQTRNCKRKTLVSCSPHKP